MCVEQLVHHYFHMVKTDEQNNSILLQFDIEKDMYIRMIEHTFDVLHNFFDSP